MRPRPAQYIVLDLETVTDTSLPPPKKKEDGSESFPAPPYHEIVVMGAALLDRNYRLRRIWCVAEDKDEATMLSALTTFLGEQLASGQPVTLVSWNGRGFDLPTIIARCLRHGIPFLWYYAQRAVRNRYSAEGHLDLMDWLADHGAGRSYGLDLAAKLIGLPGKLDCKGTDVQAMVDAGQLAEVRAYCMQDVAQTVALFLRVQLLRGEVDTATCAHALQVLLATMAGEPRLAPLLPLIDQERLVPRVEVGPSLVRGAA